MSKPIKYAYLAGAIFGQPDPWAWRHHARVLAPEGWECVVPTPLQDASQTPIELVRLDVALISKCRAILAKVDVPSWGTGMELRIAMNMGIPVYAFAAPWPRSPWLTAHVTKFCLSLEAAMRELK